MLRLLNNLRQDDLYAALQHFPNPEHRSVALSRQVTQRRYPLPSALVSGVILNPPPWGLGLARPGSCFQGYGSLGSGVTQYMRGHLQGGQSQFNLGSLGYGVLGSGITSNTILHLVMASTDIRGVSKGSQNGPSTCKTSRQALTDTFRSQSHAAGHLPQHEAHLFTFGCRCGRAPLWQC